MGFTTRWTQKSKLENPLVFAIGDIWTVPVRIPTMFVPRGKSQGAWGMHKVGAIR